MSVRDQIMVLMDEYASGERPQNEVTDDIVLLIDTAYDEGRESGYSSGLDVGFDAGYEDGFDTGSMPR
jgi:hypothetical protein